MTTVAHVPMFSTIHLDWFKTELLLVLVLLLLLLLLLSLFIFFSFAFELWDSLGLEKKLGVNFMKNLKLSKKTERHYWPGHYYQYLDTKIVFTRAAPAFDNLFMELFRLL